jgi:hypothetical protein
MRKGIGYALVAVAVVFAGLGLALALAAGGYEADALRVGGVVFLVVAAVTGVVGVLLLRSSSRD